METVTLFNEKQMRYAEKQRRAALRRRMGQVLPQRWESNEERRCAKQTRRMVARAIRETRALEESL